MDLVPPEVSVDMRNEIYEELAEAMISAIERGEMLYEEGEESAKFILEFLDKVTNAEELITFFENLTQKWSIYNSVYMKIKSDQAQENDAGKIADLQNNLNQLTNS